MAAHNVPHDAHEHDAHEHAHPHAQHGPEHEHDHGHEHTEPAGMLGWLFHGHKHAGAQIDNALESNAEGIRALKISLLGLLATALLQAVIAYASGSAALLADTIHNFSDALTAIPLWLAFSISRRKPNDRYTYGYGRAEDLAGLAIVLMIALSAALAGYESFRKLINPQPVQQIAWVIVAAIVGGLGNEIVAEYRIRVGQRIGSAALVADGHHARVDGLTSLAVLIGAVGVYLGFPQADPLIGLLITGAILFILKDTIITMWYRMMDAVDPALTRRIDRTARSVAGVLDLHEIRVRWIGHRLHCELNIDVAPELSTADSHAIAEHVRHALLHELAGLDTVIVHVDPVGPQYHHELAHHDRRDEQDGQHVHAAS